MSEQDCEERDKDPDEPAPTCSGVFHWVTREVSKPLKSAHIVAYNLDIRSIIKPRSRLLVGVCLSGGPVR